VTAARWHPLRCCVDAKVAVSIFNNFGVAFNVTSIGLSCRNNNSSGNYQSGSQAAVSSLVGSRRNDFSAIRKLVMRPWAGCALPERLRCSESQAPFFTLAIRSSSSDSSLGSRLKTANRLSNERGSMANVNKNENRVGGKGAGGAELVQGIS